MDGLKFLPGRSVPAALPSSFLFWPSSEPDTVHFQPPGCCWFACPRATRSKRSTSSGPSPPSSPSWNHDFAPRSVTAEVTLSSRTSSRLGLPGDGAIVGGGGDPAWQGSALDPVRDQLRGEIVVVAARMVRRTVQRQVAVGGAIDRHDRRKVLFRVAWVHADAARVLLPLGHQRGRYDRQKKPSHSSPRRRETTY